MKQSAGFEARPAMEERGENLRAFLTQVAAKPGILRKVRPDLLAPLAELPSGAEWVFEAERYMRACGCRESAAIGLLGLLTGAAVGYASAPPPSLFVAAGYAIGYAVGGFVVGAVFGKVYGLLQARGRFKRRTQRWLDSLTV